MSDANVRKMFFKRFVDDCSYDTNYITTGRRERRSRDVRCLIILKSKKKKKQKIYNETVRCKETITRNICKTLVNYLLGALITY